MNATDHPLAPELLMAFVDRETAGPDEARVREHLDACAECRALAVELRERSAGLRLWTVPPLSSEAASRIAARLAREAGPRKKWIEPLSRRFVWIVVGAAIAAPMALFFLRARAPADMFRAKQALYSSEAVHIAGAPRESRLGFESGSDALGARVGDARIDTISPAVPMIAHTAEIAVVVRDLDATRARMDQILARHRGYPAELAVSGAPGSARSLEASLRVPSGELPAALAELKNLGRVEKEAQKGEEITAAYVDLTARLANAKETEGRLVEILRTRAGKVSEVLEVEQQISGTREEIERMEAERKAMETRVWFATVSVSISEEYKAALEPASPAGTRLRNALVRGVENARESGTGALAWAASLLPTLLLWGSLLLFPLRWGWRRWQRALGQTG
jgi:uncharacterized small protein (DUF1192 family)